MKIPKFVPTIVSQATTYHFRLADNEPFGWALCSVNDGTGELLITSDYGNWSHRWSADPKHLGHPTLTHFLGERAGEDYLAAKLLGRRSCYEWDRAATVREFRKRLAERRLDRGRRYASVPECLRDADYLEPLRSDGRRMLTRDAAREMWDLLGDLEGAHDEREFLDRFMADDDLTYWVSERPFEETQDRPSRDYEILTKGILPALVEACAAEVKRRAERQATCITVVSAAAPRFVALPVSSCVPGANVTGYATKDEAELAALSLNNRPEARHNLQWASALHVRTPWCVLDQGELTRAQLA